jgi:hypothetical protein
VIVEIVDHGEVVGSIVLDSKNHSRWSNRFTSKLRSDQLAAGADFAVLSSSVFPAGAQQLHIQDGVIVASPARVVVLVHLLRRQIIENHVHKLSGEARNDKAEALLAYLTSPQAGDLLGQLDAAAGSMLDLEVREVEAHHSVWRKRGELIRTVQKTHEDLVGAIDAILNGREPAMAGAST